MVVMVIKQMLWDTKILVTDRHYYAGITYEAYGKLKYGAKPLLIKGLRHTTNFTVPFSESRYTYNVLQIIQKINRSSNLM